MFIQKLYEVPQRTDEEGRRWYECLSDMHFATREVGWAVGSRQILRTEDGGRTWFNQFKSHEDYSYLNPTRVFSVSPNECWIVAILSSTDIRCCYTKDGGVVWIGKRFEDEIYPRNIFFINPKRGWLLSDNVGFPATNGKVHVTDDGGETWNEIDVELNGTPNRINFYNDKKGWLLEHFVNPDETRTYSQLHATEDGGFRWRAVKRFDRRIADFCVLADSRLVVAGENGYIAATSNSGLEWKRMESKNRVFINAIRFNGNGVGIALCDNDTVLLSKDAGQTWGKIDAPKDAGNFVNVHFETKSSGVIASSNAIHSFNLSI